MGHRMRTIVAGASSGAVASWAKAKMEPPLQRLGERAFAPRPGQEDQRGADSTAVARMPPVLLARGIARRTIGRDLSTDGQTTAMGVIHYGFGIGAGIAYACLADRWPLVRKGGGSAAGAVLWTMTHGSTVPLLGLQAPPTTMPTAWYVWELGSHVGFGLVLETTRRALLRAM